MKKAKPARNFLIIITLTGLIFVGWAAGNNFRKLFQERQGLGSLQSNTPQIIGRVPIQNWSPLFSQECKDDVYYTSLPAKCQTVDGRLIEAGNDELDMILIPWLDDPEE